MRELGVEPGRDGHHVGLSSQRCLPSLVCARVLVGITLRPSIPRKGTVDVVFGARGGANTGPVRNEEAASVLFDPSPVTLATHAFKGRDKWFRVVAELSVAGCVGECIDHIGRNTSVPLAIGQIVKGEEEAKVAVVIGRLSCEFDGRFGVGIAGCDVQGKSVNADISSFGDVV